MNKELDELSMLEQSIHHSASQKQNFNVQLLEIESALSELKEETAYKIIANIMVKKDSAELKKELQEKADLIKIRIQTIDKQETSLREKFKELQKKIMGNMNEKVDE